MLDTVGGPKAFWTLRALYKTLLRIIRLVIVPYFIVVCMPNTVRGALLFSVLLLQKLIYDILGPWSSANLYWTPSFLHGPNVLLAVFFCNSKMPQRSTYASSGFLAQKTAPVEKLARHLQVRAWRLNREGRKSTLCRHAQAHCIGGSLQFAMCPVPQDRQAIRMWPLSRLCCCWRQSHCKQCPGSPWRGPSN